MNWDTIEGKWEEFRGQVRSKWAKLTDDDVIVIEAQEQRTQGRNREAARERLADLIRRALRRPRTRRPTKPCSRARLSARVPCRLVIASMRPR